MTDWYVSSAAYATYTAFQTTHAYIIGDLMVPSAPAAKAKYVFRCTTAGTSAGSEPSWTATSDSSTQVTGTATFTNVTGQSTYGWSAAAGDMLTLTNVVRVGSGDRVFVSSDHSETQSTASHGSGASQTAGYGVIEWLCVNRAGSVPPVAADMTTGATAVSSGTFAIPVPVEIYFYGFTFSVTGSSSLAIGGTSSAKTVYFKNCQLYLNTATAVALAPGATNASMQRAILDNTTLRCSSTSHQIAGRSGANFEVIWTNTASALAGATFPTVLFNPISGGSSLTVTCRGVDLSSVTGTLVVASASAAGANIGGSRYLFDSCKIASAVIRYDPTGILNTNDIVELVNCYDGTHYVTESYSPLGAVTTEFTIYLYSGAADNNSSFSHKMVSNANADKFTAPLCGFWMDAELTATGVSHTLSVDIISSTALNNDEIALYVEYRGTASSSITSFVDSFIATPMTTPAAVTSVTIHPWASRPATPVAQRLSVTFTPQVAGRVRGQVRLGKTSATVYYNPQLRISA